MSVSPGQRAAQGRGASRPARTLLERALRVVAWLVIAFWIAAVIAVSTSLPSIGQGRGTVLGGMLPKHAAALSAQRESATRFAFPLLSSTIIVQRDPHGMSLAEQARAFELARQLTAHRVPGFAAIRGALPITNAVGAPPFAREHSSTVLTYLFFRPSTDLGARTRIARRLLRTHVAAVPGETAGVTGEAPGHVAETGVINSHLSTVEIVTVALVALMLAVRFRSLGAPLVALGAVVVAFELADHLVAWVGQRAGLPVPSEVEPIMVVLILGIVTDYTVFFLSRFRGLLEEELDPLRAAVRTSRAVSPIVLVAGITIAAATAALAVAHLGFFRAIGPGLAVTVLICVLVVLTLIPAALICFGPRIYWPARVPLWTGRGPARAAPLPRGRMTDVACRHPYLAGLACLLAIGAGASGLMDLRLGNPVVRGLPNGTSARQAYLAATHAFAPGVVAPTVVLVNRPGVTRQRAALASLQALISRQRGVALVLGPAENPLKIQLGAALARGGGAARYLVFLDANPLGAQAISDVRNLQQRLPHLAAEAGLAHAALAYAGDTALSAETINDTLSDLMRFAPVALLAMLLVLVVYLRALIAPLYLVAASMVSFAAALGIAVYFFRFALSDGGIAFFIPFVAAVLLISLGSDYNVFLIGNIWQEARERDLREAVRLAAARSTRAITLAGLILAASFALLALIPLEEFRQLAFVMAVGLLIDTLLVRTILVPALITIVGARSGWPGHRLRRTAPGADPAPTALPTLGE